MARRERLAQTHIEQLLGTQDLLEALDQAHHNRHAATTNRGRVRPGLPWRDAEGSDELTASQQGRCERNRADALRRRALRAGQEALTASQNARCERNRAAALKRKADREQAATEAKMQRSAARSSPGSASSAAPPALLTAPGMQQRLRDQLHDTLDRQQKRRKVVKPSQSDEHEW